MKPNGSLKIEYRPISELRPYARNARTHSAGQLAMIKRSLVEFGWTNPVLLDGKNGVIAGHGRILAAAEVWKAGEKITRCPVDTIPCIDLDGLTEPQKRAYILADNQIATQADWDEELLKSELAALAGLDFDLPVIGFSDRELKDLLAAPPAGGPDPGLVPEPPKVKITRPGDLWILGKHRLLCGDTFEPDDVRRLTGDKTVGMVLTDPPYAIYGSSTGISADIADDKMVRPFFEKLGAVVEHWLPEFGHAYIHCDWRSYATLWHGMKSAGLAPKNCIVWDKGSAGLGNSYANTHEFVAFFAKLPPMKAMTSGRKAGQRQVLQPNVFRTDRVTGDERLHNAAKPVDLLAWLIGNSSDRGDVVLDLFCGSGSTIIAGEREGRACYAMEMEPRHVDVSVLRWERFTGGQAATPEGRTFAEVAKERGQAQ